MQGPQGSCPLLTLKASDGPRHIQSSKEGGGNLTLNRALVELISSLKNKWLTVRGAAGRGDCKDEKSLLLVDTVGGGAKHDVFSKLLG